MYVNAILPSAYVMLSRRPVFEPLGQFQLNVSGLPSSIELGWPSRVKALTVLESLSLHQAKVGERGLEQLRKALPNASVSGSKADY